MIFKRSLPLAIATATGLLTLIALLFQLPALSSLLLGWATFLAAVALLLGVLNLFAIHLTRSFTTPGHRLYSAVLVLTMLLMFGLALSDARQLTQNGVDTLFRWVQAPLEAALASLLAFLLLFSGLQLFKRQRTVGSVLFLTTAVFTLLLAINASGLFATLIPATLSQILQQSSHWLQEIVVRAGMRGLLLGVALGTITLSIRVLAGWERPYSQ